jgi:SAM-dependent methyltransferase
MPTINRLEPFTALSDVYQSAGFARYSAELAPRLLDLAFELEWTGRSLYDMACGTGDAANWFSERGFRVLGVDSSPHMLRVAKADADARNLSPDYATGDIRTYDVGTQFELVTCLGGSLNYIPTLRDLENVFRQAQASVGSKKLFVFDLQTIQGLSSQEATDKVLFDNGDDMFIVQREMFNYETLLLTRQYAIFVHSEKSGWQRAEETHQLRGYPVQAIMGLLGKTGFKVLRMFTPDLQPIDMLTDEKQVLFVAVKEN